MNPAGILERLFQVIEDRKLNRPAGSYVVQLLDGGVSVIGAKIREEAEEVIEAGAENDPAHLAREVADLFFHTWILMAREGVAPADVYAVLESRFGVGGLDEKARRSEAGGDESSSSRKGDPSAR